MAAAAVVVAWTGGVPRAEAACAATSVQVLVQPILAPSEVIPVSWHVDPACAVIETGLLLGSDPAALSPVGSPIYEPRPRYQQDLPVRESGTYWVAAYARDESGEVVQSRPRSVFVVVPLRPLDDSRRLDEPSSLHLSGAHGPLPVYSRTDADFLEPAGEPHFAALRRIIRTGESSHINSVFRRGWAASQSRTVSSTQRDEILAQQAPPFTPGGVTLLVNPADVGTALNQLDTAFPALGYPRFVHGVL